MALDDSDRYVWEILTARADEAVEAEIRHFGADDGAHHLPLVLDTPAKVRQALLALEELTFRHMYEEEP